ncbi:hypothetical protein PD5205_03453 [Xanthomonas fragariae]|uniref:Uncharacterized protein n=1 Tax=Xanthomonas fragariae TaxID=48664 RepID=A0A1Y6HMK0_9XANT|nr:hypothetical protein PD885_00539 [Xanthomonas fragariae]SMR04729.1 hypothetical protein PD5205_03453 [Xanthomonas fragariae]
MENRQWGSETQLMQRTPTSERCAGRGHGSAVECRPCATTQACRWIPRASPPQARGARTVVGRTRRAMRLPWRRGEAHCRTFAPQRQTVLRRIWESVVTIGGQRYAAHAVPNRRPARRRQPATTARSRCVIGVAAFRDSFGRPGVTAAGIDVDDRKSTGARHPPRSRPVRCPAIPATAIMRAR